MVELLSKVKDNLMINHDEDDELLERLILSAIAYAESYQHIEEGTYLKDVIPATTEQAIIMLSSHFYESRDGSTAGFYNDNVNASNQVWNTVNLLLRMDKRWEL